MDSFDERARLRQLPRAELEALQLSRLNDVLARVLPENRFYRDKLTGHRLPLDSLSRLSELPFTGKDELSANVDGVRPTNATYPLERYVRFHRTSGTRGRALPVLDTAADWRWWVQTWQFVLDVAEVSAADRVFMAFSFGPFIGFWSAHDAVAERGALVVPGGGLSTLSRLELIQAVRATIVCCTPSYALRLAEIAELEQIDLRELGVRSLIVAGEPGGSDRAIRERINQTWGADVVDHAGATEVGPWGFSNSSRTGLQVVESEFIAEFLPLGGQWKNSHAEVAELVLTTLGRYGAPVIRYRTGDLVRPVRPPDERGFVELAGGVLGRRDDMLIVRGVNVFPSSLDSIIREFASVVEYRVTATRDGTMDALKIEIEDRGDSVQQVTRAIEMRLGLRVNIEVVAAGSLPRFEGKGGRFVDLRRVAP